MLQPIIETLLAPWVTLRDFFTELYSCDDRLRNEMSFGGRLIAWLTLPWRLLLGCFTFIAFAWASTRSGFAFIRGLPAILVIGGFFGALVLVDLVNTEAKMIGANMAYYQRHVDRSPDNPEWAEMFARKLTEIKPDDPMPKYLLGLSLQRSGKPNRAEDIMRAIAPQDAPGYGPAHVWLANQLLKNDQIGNIENAELAEQHLKLAAQASVRPDQSKDAEPIYQLAELYRKRAEAVRRQPADNDAQRQQLIQEEIELLKKSDEQYQRLADMDGAQVYTIQSLETSTRVKLKLAELIPEGTYSRENVEAKVNRTIERLHEQARRRYPDIVALWQTLAAASVALDDYQQAIEILESGMASVSNSRLRGQLESTAARVKINSAVKIKDCRDLDNYNQRLSDICDAIDFKPRDETAYVLLLDFVGQDKGPGTADESANTGQNASALANPEAGYVPVDLGRLLAFSQKYAQHRELMNVVVGMQKMNEGDFTGGTKSWNIGQEYNEKTRQYLYHLLNTAAKYRSDKFSNLLDMISFAIEMFPEEYAFYATRGIFLHGQGRTAEAIADLEAANEKIVGGIVLDYYLKVCYEKLGQTDKARRRQQAIDRELEQMSDSDRKIADKQLELLAVQLSSN